MSLHSQSIFKQFYIIGHFDGNFSRSHNSFHRCKLCFYVHVTSCDVTPFPKGCLNSFTYSGISMQNFSRSGIFGHFNANLEPFGITHFADVILCVSFRFIKYLWFGNDQFWQFVTFLMTMTAKRGGGFLPA